MASPDCNRRLHQSEKDAMWNTWAKLIARHAASVSPPVDRAIFRDLLFASLGHYESVAWAAMQQWWDGMDQDIDADEVPFKTQGAVGVTAVMHGGEMIQLQLERDFMHEHKWPVFERNGKPTLKVQAYDILGADRYAEFLAWASTTIEVAYRSFNTTRILTAIHDMASTVGQLHRMAPDLVRYSFPQTQKALAAQVRRSPLPNEWMKVDRAELHRALDHMALCYLLPEAGEERGTYANVLDSACWAFDSTTCLELIHYYARPDTIQTASLYTYSPTAPLT